MSLVLSVLFYKCWFIIFFYKTLLVLHISLNTKYKCNIDGCGPRAQWYPVLLQPSLHWTVVKILKKILLFLFLPYRSPSYLLKVEYIRILWMMHICCHICQSRDNLRISRHYRERQLYWWDQPGTWLYHQAHHRIASQKPKLIKIRDEEEIF